MNFSTTVKRALAITLFLLFICYSTTFAGWFSVKEKIQLPQAAETWEPANTIAMLVGVLSWKDKSLDSFTTANRYDQKLYDELLKRGVAKKNIIFLKDKQTSLANIQDSLKKLVEKSNEKSVFLFYYAGHGDRSEDCKDAYFLNYDCDAENLATTSFKLSELAEVVKNGFKGKIAILTADCCYSGYLNLVADELEKSGISTLVMSSASANNESTGEWTFTSSLHDILSGRPLYKDVEAQLTADFAREYIRYNMTYAENQLANFYQTESFPKRFILAQKQSGYDENKPYLGQFKLASHEEELTRVRIIDQKGSSCKILFSGFDPVWSEWRDYADLKDIDLKIYPVGSQIMVEWDKKWYKASVLKNDGVFHLVHYEDFESNWDEWVAADRIKIK